MTKKNLTASLSLILLAALTAAAQAPADWVKFSPPGGRFDVLMPAPPTKEGKVTKQSRYGPFTVYIFASFGPAGEGYAVGWADFERKFDMNLQAELEFNRDEFIKTVKAKLLSTTPIKLGAHPGIEVKAEVTGKVDIVARIYIVGRRPYVLLMATPTGRDSSADRERFFSSFRLGAAR